MYTVLITGGTGMIGKALTGALLEKNYNVIILTRQPEKQNVAALRLSYARWNIPNQTIDKEAIAKSDYIIHLAGAGIADKQWTKKRKQEIVDSRVKSGELLVKTLKENANNVKAMISASAIGWYGTDRLTPGPSPHREESGLRKFEESDPPADDFLGQTCKQWEESLEPVIQLNKRLVKLRTGIVLSNEGGALPEFIKPLRFGIAPILSNGRQIMSWIHIEDLVRIYIAAIENDNMSGVYNAVAPRPVSNKELVLQLAKIKRGSFYVPIHVPSFILKLILGEMSIEVLKSAMVSGDKINLTGFTFLYPSLESALKQLSGKKNKTPLSEG
jgi:uncharacterized protein (TIGR01777 family)